MASTAEASRTSAANAKPRRPRDSISFIGRKGAPPSRGGSRSPRRRRPRRMRGAMPRPMPREAPVTRARLPSRRARLFRHRLPLLMGVPEDSRAPRDLLHRAPGRWHGRHAAPIATRSEGGWRRRRHRSHCDCSAAIGMQSDEPEVAGVLGAQRAVLVHQPADGAGGEALGDGDDVRDLEGTEDEVPNRARHAVVPQGRAEVVVEVVLPHPEPVGGARRGACAYGDARSRRRSRSRRSSPCTRRPARGRRAAPRGAA